MHRISTPRRSDPFARAVDALPAAGKIAPARVALSLGEFHALPPETQAEAWLELRRQIDAERETASDG